MSNYNSQLYSNTTDLQEVLQILQTKATGASNGENLDVEISTQATLLSEQDAKIAELAQVLAGKASSSENNFKTAEITIQSSNRIISVVYTGIENMTPTARYSYVAGGSVVITALQGTSIIVFVESHMSTNTSGAVNMLERDDKDGNNMMGYILNPNIRCFHVPYGLGDTGLIKLS